MPAGLRGRVHMVSTEFRSYWLTWDKDPPVGAVTPVQMEEAAGVERLLNLSLDLSTGREMVDRKQP